MKAIRVTRRTPPGQPDKPISFWPLLASFTGVITVAGTLFTWSVNMMIFRAQAETKDQLRIEMNAKYDDVRKNTWPLFYTKAEIDERRKELDRRYEEEKAQLLLIQQAIMELKLHDAEDHVKR